jgi:hypothetical protein
MSVRLDNFFYGWFNVIFGPVIFDAAPEVLLQPLSI